MPTELKCVARMLDAMPGRVHEQRVDRRDVSVERDVLAVVVAAHALGRQAHHQWIFTQKLVCQRVAVDHELRVLAGGARQSLVELERLNASLGALLVDERQQLLFRCRLNRILCECRRRGNKHGEQAAPEVASAPKIATMYGMCRDRVASRSIRRRKVTSVRSCGQHTIQERISGSQNEQCHGDCNRVCRLADRRGHYLAVRAVKLVGVGATEDGTGAGTASVRSQLGQAQAENSVLNAAKASVEATLESERGNTKEKLELLNAASEEMKAQFKALASTALESNNASFLQLAKSELEKQQSEAESELEKRATAVETLVKPIAESLKNVDEHVRALESSRAEAYGGLKAHGRVVARVPKCTAKRRLAIW